MNTLTIGMRAFRALVDPVLPMASKDDTLPMLNGVKIVTLKGHLVAYATDRYRIGVQRSEIAAKDFDTLFPVGAIRMMQRMYKASHRLESQLRITLQQDKHGKKKIIVQGTTGDPYVPHQTMVIEPYEQTEKFKYPSILPLVKTALDAKVVSTAHVNMELLSGFTAATDWQKPMGIQFPEGNGKPILLRAGDDFTGIIMPVRGNAPDNTEWSKLLDGAA